MAQSNPKAARDLPRGPTSKVLRPQDQAAWSDGYRFLDEAKRVHAEEKQRGYAEGKAAGAQEASQLIMETTAKVDRYLASLDREVAGLALDIVRRVLGEFDKTELVARAAATAVADFRREKALKIAVHPSAEARVRDVVAQYTRPGLSIVVEGDPALGQTDCLLSSEFAIVNASIDAQLEAMARALGLRDRASAP